MRLQDILHPGRSNTEDDGPKWKYLTISLVRHAECESNVNPNSKPGDSDPDPLTADGRSQASALGESFSRIRIDAILASVYERAQATALAIADANLYYSSSSDHGLSSHTTKMPIIPSDELIERKLGTVIPRLMRDRLTNAALKERDGNAYDGSLDRDHRPAGGGESLTDVEKRAERFLVKIMKEYAVELKCVPKEVEKIDVTTRYDPPPRADEGGLGSTGSGKAGETTRGACREDDVPEGVNHVVLVSHNAFMAEFYEMLLSWGKDEHEQTEVHYLNTGWSRHLVRYRVSEEGEMEVEFWDLRTPTAIC